LFPLSFPFTGQEHHQTEH